MRKMIQDVFIRLCRDSGFRLSAVAAAQLTGMMLERTPLEIWLSMPSWDVMKEIAAGTHPAALT
jgi:hypothetical protein